MDISRGRCRLQEWLDKRAMTQADFARKSNLSERVISYYCTGERRMSPEAMYIASKILNVPMDWLYEWLEDKA